MRWRRRQRQQQQRQHHRQRQRQRTTTLVVLLVLCGFAPTTSSRGGPWLVSAFAPKRLRFHFQTTAHERLHRCRRDCNEFRKDSEPTSTSILATKPTVENGSGNDSGSGSGSGKRRTQKNNRSGLDRRSVLISVAGLVTAAPCGGGGGGGWVLTTGDTALGLQRRLPSVAMAPASAATRDSVVGCPRFSDAVVRSLVYERVLGAGSYKTVYLVSAIVPLGNDDEDSSNKNKNKNKNNKNANGSSTKPVRYAMAVERLRTKKDVKNAVNGVRIPDRIRGTLSHPENDGALFETIVDWWFQPTNVKDFGEGNPVFSLEGGSSSGSDSDSGSTIRRRTRSEPPKNFAGSVWMVSLKPVYEIDLKRFVLRAAPERFPVGTARGFESQSESDSSKIRRAQRLDAFYGYWTEEALLRFVAELLHAGALMHEAGFVHRDIKPKNIMIDLVEETEHDTESGTAGSRRRQRRRPVIIDYGFAEVASPTVLSSPSSLPSPSSSPHNDRRTDLCVVRPGQLKGEADYVLAEDLANYRGCQRGDAYAMGKTIYEFVFGSEELLLANNIKDAKISVEAAEANNQAFFRLLSEEAAAMERTQSRFPLSRDAADCLLKIVMGLCGSGSSSGNSHRGPETLAEAEAFLSDFCASR